MQMGTTSPKKACQWYLGNNRHKPVKRQIVEEEKIEWVPPAPTFPSPAYVGDGLIDIEMFKQ